MQRAQQRQPLMPDETPSRAWQIVGTDLFVINRETYLLVSDYYSKFPFVYLIPSPVTSTAVIAKIKSLFSEQGVPQRVISNNGGHFSPDAFRRFADQWCFDHVTSSPHYPQSNSFIERRVQTVKHTLKKVGHRSDVQMALLVLRATPIDSRLPSPAELLYGRRVVSNLPVATWNASDKRCEIRARLDQRQATAKERHDACVLTDLAELSSGQHVRTRDPITHMMEPGRIAPRGSNRPAEEYCRRTGATSARPLRSMYFSTPTMTRSATPLRLLLMVRDQSPSNHTRTARSLRQLSQ